MSSPTLSPWITLSQDSVTATTDIISSVETSQQVAAVNRANQTAQAQKNASDIEAARIQAQKDANAEIVTGDSSANQEIATSTVPTWGKAIAVTVAITALGSVAYFLALPRKSRNPRK